jgi:hypothetical protein
MFPKCDSPLPVSSLRSLPTAFVELLLRWRHSGVPDGGALAPLAPFRRSHIRRDVRFPSFRSRTVPPSVSHPHLVWGGALAPSAPLRRSRIRRHARSLRFRSRCAPPSVAIRLLWARHYGFCSSLSACSPFPGLRSLFLGSFDSPFPGWSLQLLPSAAVVADRFPFAPPYWGTAPSVRGAFLRSNEPGLCHPDDGKLSAGSCSLYPGAALGYPVLVVGVDAGGRACSCVVLHAVSP